MADCKKLQRRRNDWSIRMQYEFEFWEKRNSIPIIALLTYDNEHLVKTKSGNPTLVQKHVQNFMKSLRKALSKDDIFCRYFYAGEYGPTRGRPHYHILVFGIPKTMSLNKCFKLFQRCWPHGFVGNEFDYCRSKQGSCTYVTKYMLSKALPLLDPEQEPEFNRFSKGLGISFVFDVDIDEHGLHVSKEKVCDKRFRNSSFESALIDIYDELFPYIPGFGRSEYPTVDYESREAIEISRTIQSYLCDRVRMECKLKSYNFKLPRYIRERLFLPHERRLLQFSDVVLYHLPRLKEYQRKFSEYDSTHDVPMWLLQEIEEEKRLISFFVKRSKEDKI